MRVSFYTKDRYDFWKDICPFLDECEIVEGVANWILLSFFELNEEQVRVVDREKLEAYGLDREPINWGSIGVTSVEKKEDGTFLIVIEEGNSRKLERLVEELMAKWGWKVKCVCEW